MGHLKAGTETMCTIGTVLANLESISKQDLSKRNLPIASKVIVAKTIRVSLLISKLQSCISKQIVLDFIALRKTDADLASKLDDELRFICHVGEASRTFRKMVVKKWCDASINCSLVYIYHSLLFK